MSHSPNFSRAWIWIDNGRWMDELLHLLIIIIPQKGIIRVTIAISPRILENIIYKSHPKVNWV
jgi:hypothetical protein